MKFNSLIESIHAVDEYARRDTARAVNVGLTLRNWAIGLYISRYELQGEDRAQYGDDLFKRLAEELSEQGVRACHWRQLYRYRAFYRTYPQILGALTPQFAGLLPAHGDEQSENLGSLTPKFSLSAEQLLNSLSYTHLEQLVAIEDPLKRAFYEVECIRGTWSVRELKRQIGTLYFERSALSKDKAALAKHVASLAEPDAPEMVLRDPMVFEFLGKGVGRMSTNGWRTVPLGEVISHRKEFVDIDDLQTYKRCRVQLHAKGVVLRDEIEGARIKTKKQQVCRPDEFLVAEIDAKVGGFGMVPQELDGAIASSHYFLFSPNRSLLDPAYLDYYCRTPYFRDQVKARGSTNYAAIRPGHVLAYEIPLPSLSEQRRIVSKIEQLAGKIEEARGLRVRAVSEEKALVRSASRHAFESIADYKTPALETVCTEIIDCLHSNAVYSADGIPTVRSPDVGWGRLLLATARKTKEDEYRRRTRRGEPQPGDIVLVREGGGTGKAGIVEDGQRLSLGQRVMQLRPDAKKVLPRFLLHQWLSPVIQEHQIVERMKGSASPHLNIKALRRFDFILPPLPEQRRIVTYLDDLQTKVDRLKELQAKTSTELNALLPSILDKAFKGEL